MIKQYEPLIDKKVGKALQKYVDSGGWLTEYTETEKFEEAICKALKVPYTVCVNNGTMAISLALLAAGVKPGDKVLVPNLTMGATPFAVQLIGAKPILVDIEKETLCMDLKLAYSIIQDHLRKGQNIKAVIYVSLNGRRHPHIELGGFAYKCRELGVTTIEDAAQSFGSKDQYGSCGSMLDMTTFSFSPHKVITTGQGGAITTEKEELVQNLRLLKDFGRRESGTLDIYTTFGINCKFTDLQAVVGLVQLQDLDKRLKRKREIYNLYRANLQKVNSIKFVPMHEYAVPWFVDIYTLHRSILSTYLKSYEIESRIIYPPIHMQPALQNDGYYPISEYFSQRGLWLPSSMNLTDNQIETICNHIKQFFK